MILCFKDKTKTLRLTFAFFFPFFIFPISHSTVIYRAICVKHFTVYTEPRVLKVDRNIKYDFLYCVRGKQHPPTNLSPYYLSIFLSNEKFCHRFFSSYESQTLNFVSELRVAKNYMNCELYDVAKNIV